MKKSNFFLLIFVIIVSFFGIVIYKNQSERKLLYLTTPFAKEEMKISRVEPHLSINEIFSRDHRWIKTIPSDRIITVIATGDVIPARSVNYQTISRNNFKWPFEKTAAFLKDVDITLINLESPLINDCPTTNTGMIFCGRKHHVEGLRYAGIDVANFANNHMGNYGEKAIAETEKLLKENGIAVTGISGGLFKEIKGVKFAFLGYNDIAGGELLSRADDPEKIKSEVFSAKKNSDVIVVSFHWGDEYTAKPNIRQKELAHLAIDSGADLIIGNHPHWIQPVEIYKDKLIVYAHGNFIFDQMWSEKTKEGVVGRYTFYGNKLIDAQLFPIYIQDFGQPYFLEGEEKERILREMGRESLKLLSR